MNRNTLEPLHKKANALTGTTILFLAYIVFILLTVCETLTNYISMMYSVFLAVIVMRNKEACEYCLRDTKSFCLIAFLLMHYIEGVWVGGVVHITKKVFTLFAIYSTFLYFNYFKRNNMYKEISRILKVTYGVLVVISIQSIITYIRDPGLARRVAKHIDGALLLGGGYNLAIGSCLLSVFITDLLVRGYFDQKKKWKYPLIGSVVIFGILVYYTQSTLTFLAWIIGEAWAIFFKKKENRSFYYFKLILVPIIFVAFIVVMPYLGEWMMSTFSKGPDNPRIYDRLYSMGSLLKNGFVGEDSAYAASRITRSWDTFLTFLKSPIYGVAYKHGCGFLHPYDFGVGNHCEITDCLANFGVIGGVPYLYMHYSALREAMTRKGINMSAAVPITAIVLGLFNPFIYYTLSFVFFFFIPATTLLIEHNIEKTERQKQLSEESDNTEEV